VVAFIWYSRFVSVPNVLDVYLMTGQDFISTGIISPTLLLAVKGLSAQENIRKAIINHIAGNYSNKSPLCMVIPPKLQQLGPVEVGK